MGEYFRENRYFASIQEIPAHVINAFVAAEDLNFFRHKGVDFVGILRALIVNLREGKIKQGGSTITQQVVKNLLLTREKSFVRKIQEAVLAYQIENFLTKEQILELYLNLVFLGNNSYGVKAAAKNYFRKNLSDLTLAEATLLAGLPQAPSKYSPLRNSRAAKARQRYVLDQMVKGGFLSAKEANQIFMKELKIYPANLENYYLAPYYLAEVRKELEEILPEIDIDTEGLTIETFLISDFQHSVEKTLKKHLTELDRSYGYRGPVKSSENVYYPVGIVEKIDRKMGLAFVGINGGTIQLNLKSQEEWFNFDIHEGKKRFKPILDSLKSGDLVEVDLKTNQLVQTPEIEGAAVVINPKGGEVLALQGGFSFKVTQFNRVTQSLRQAGSAFKPFVYLTALERFGYTPLSIVNDVPRTYRIGGQIWSPQNYDEEFEGPMTLTRALERSRNLPAVFVTASVGVSNVIKTARNLGIESKLPRNLTLGLGSGDVTLIELVRAYGAICSEGVLAKTRYVKRVKNSKGQVIYDSDKFLIDNLIQGSDPRAAYILCEMMKYVVKSGTATTLKDFPVAVSGKTGTTNDFVDAWFIASTPEITGGVWIGFDTRKSLGEKMTGGRLAAPLWKEFMGEIYQIINQNKVFGLFNGVQDFPTTTGVTAVYFNPINGRFSLSPVEGFYLGFVKNEDIEKIKPFNVENQENISKEDYLRNPNL